MTQARDRARCRCAVLVIWAVTLLSSSASHRPLGEVPAGTITYLAAETSAGGASLLYLVRQSPLYLAPLATLPGQTAALAVAEGTAYWALNNTDSTSLYRVRHREHLPVDIHLLGTVALTGVRTADLKSDGRVIYWTTTNDATSQLFRCHNGLESALMIGTVNGQHRSLIAENGEAFWAFETGTPESPTTWVQRYGSQSPIPILIVSGYRFEHMVLDNSQLCVLTTQVTSGTPRTRIYRNHVSSSGTSIMAQESGTPRWIACRDGLVTYAFENLSARHQIRARQIPRLWTLIPSTYPQLQNDGPGGVELSSIFGCAWRHSEDTLHVQVFHRFPSPESGHLFNSITYSNTRLVGSALMGDDVWLALESPNGESPRMVRFHSHQGGLSPYADQPLSGSALALDSSPWRLLVATESRLYSFEANGTVSSLSVQHGNSAQIASGPDGRPHYPFAANTDTDKRELFPWGTTAPVPPAPGDHPTNLFCWGGRLWANVLLSGQRELAAYGPPSSAHLGWNLPNPDGLREAFGRLFLRLRHPSREGEPDFHTAAFLDWTGGTQQPIIDEFPLGAGIPFEAFGALYFDRPDSGTLVRLTSDLTPVSIPRGANSKIGAPISDWLPFANVVYFRTETSDGKQGLFMLGPGWHSAEQLFAAEEIGALTAHRGEIFFIARDDSGEALFRINPVTHFDLRRIRPFTDHGISNPRLLISYSESLVLLADAENGLTAFTLDRDGTERASRVVIADSGWPPFPVTDVTAKMFLGHLHLVINPDTPDALLFRFPPNAYWLQGFGEATLFDGRVFATHVDSLGERRLAWARGGPFVQLLGPFDLPGFNPVGLSVFQHQLMFAASAPGQGRELWAQPPTGTPFTSLTQLGDSGRPANPIIDGPRNIQPLAITVPGNLPTGITLATLTAHDEGTPGPIHYTPDPWWWSQNMEIQGSQLRTTGPLPPSPHGQENFQFRAFNRWNIFNPATLQINVIEPAQAWLNHHFPADHFDPSTFPWMADFDDDGIVNLLEMALAMNPSEASGSDGPAGLPIISITNGPGSPRLTLSFRTPLGLPTNLIYAIQASDNLHHWNNIATLYAAPGGGDLIWHGPSVDSIETTIHETDQVIEYTVPDIEILGTSPRRFLRLKIYP